MGGGCIREAIYVTIKHTRHIRSHLASNSLSVIAAKHRRRFIIHYLHQKTKPSGRREIPPLDKRLRGTEKCAGEGWPGKGNVGEKRLREVKGGKKWEKREMG